MNRIGKPIETGSSLVVAGVADGKCLLMGVRFPFGVRKMFWD